ncbi:MAG: hypothetical protein KC713_06640, partial [Candidatus Omnitrophica bacterium]|nr:hypothetical protein [Candidatus Omnitrophota bacterium]
MRSSSGFWQYLLRIILCITFILTSLQPTTLSWAASPQSTPNENLIKVADAILNWDGRNPGEMFKVVKELNPDKPAIDTIRELNASIADGKIPGLSEIK